MPLYESVCTLTICPKYGKPFEWYAHTRDMDDPLCLECEQRTSRVVSRFNAPWTGTIDRFDDPTKQSHNKIEGGHMAWRVRSSRNADGSPEPVRITTRAEQMQFCREEQLEDPAYAPADPCVSSDGMKISPQGMPGVWV